MVGTFRRWGSALGMLAMLGACGGDGGGSNSLITLPGGGGATPTPTPVGSTCSLRNRQNWVAEQLDEWYLFPETLPASLDPSPYSSVQDYIDALTATARSQGRDRFFTFITSIADENAFLQSGATAGFGIRLSYDSTARRVFIVEAFEGAPALAAGLDRGAEITGIGTTATNITDVSDLFAQGGAAAVSDAFGPSTSGTVRVLRVKDLNGTETTVSVTKAKFAIQPVSPRYGVRIIDDGDRKVGYLNLRTFIDSADNQLRDAYDQFRTAGITELIIDLRYNGGGLVSTADLMGDLMGRDRFASDIWSITSFRASKSSFNETRNFQQVSQSIGPTKIAFIGAGGTASASELVINSMLPYLGTNLALIGTDTFGKPVGQIGLDQAECDDRLRVVAFSKDNADGQGEYYDGLASTIQNTCQAPDDLTIALGDPAEASIAKALGYLRGESCTAIVPTGTATSQSQREPAALPRELLMSKQPTPAQREIPGIY